MAGAVLQAHAVHRPGTVVGAAPLHHALLQPWSDLCMGACVCMWCLLCKLLVGYAMLLGKHMLAAVVVGHEEVN